MTKGITKAERTELKSVVRNQFRVLRHEVRQRQAELVAQGEQQILEMYRGNDVARSEIDEQVQRVMDDALTAIRDLVKDRKDAGVPRRLVMPGSPIVHWAPDRRHELRAALYSDLQAKTDGALLQLDRQEADLLKNLAIGALETEQAHAFLGEIPSVAELVPAARLAELEAQFTDRDDDGP